MEELINFKFLSQSVILSACRAFGEGHGKIALPRQWGGWGRRWGGWYRGGVANKPRGKFGGYVGWTEAREILSIAKWTDKP